MKCFFSLFLVLACWVPALSWSDESIRATTFNIRYPSDRDGDHVWANRRELLMKVVKEQNADLLGLQEAFAFQLKEILDAFPKYLSEGVGRDDGKEAGEFSPLLYNHERFERLDGGTFWLSDTPDEPGSITWNNACTRVCSWLALKDKKSGRKVAAYNAHFDHKNALSRTKSARLILEMIHRQKHDDWPVIVMGDFNAGPLSDPLRFLFGDALKMDGVYSRSALPFHNSLRSEDSGRTFHGWRGGVKGRQIDYVLLSSGFKLLGSGVDRSHEGKLYPSDHYPVWAKVALAKK